MKKYLIIVEKPLMAKLFEDAYSQMRSSFQFEADFLPVNCHVENIKTSPIPQETLSQFKPFELRDKQVPEDFKIFAHGAPQIERGEEIKRMVNENHYDAVVNACDPMEDGDFEFQYMLESLGLENMETRRLYVMGFAANNLEFELMTLNEY